MSNSNQPAYPILETEIGIAFHEGLNKREYFAGLVMQGICSSGPTISNEQIALEAVCIADALLAELEK